MIHLNTFFFLSRDATIIVFFWYDYSLRNNHGFMIITHLLISQHKIT